MLYQGQKNAGSILHKIECDSFISVSRQNLIYNGPNDSETGCRFYPYLFFLTVF